MLMVLGKPNPPGLGLGDVSNRALRPKSFEEENFVAVLGGYKQKLLRQFVSTKREYTKVSSGVETSVSLSQLLPFTELSKTCILSFSSSSRRSNATKRLMVVEIVTTNPVLPLFRVYFVHDYIENHLACYKTSAATLCMAIPRFCTILRQQHRFFL